MESKPESDGFRKLRDEALRLPEQLPVSGARQNSVWAVGMDIRIGTRVSTFVARADGSVSLVFSPGGQITAGQEDQYLSYRSNLLTRWVQNFVSGFAPTVDFPLPGKSGQIRLHVVRASEVLSGITEVEALRDRRHQLRPLLEFLRDLIQMTYQAGARKKATRIEWIGEEGYCNCLLVTMVRTSTRSVEIRSDLMLPNLEELSSSNEENVQWLAEQEFIYGLLDPAKVIKLLMRSAGISRLPWAKKVGSIRAVDCVGESDPAVERLYHVRRFKASGATRVLVTLQE